MADEPTFWQAVWANLKAILAWAGRHLVAPGVALLVVVGAILLVAIGFKEVKVGGLLGWLFGKEEPKKKAVDVANSVPKGRVRRDGTPIPPGEPDSNGSTQAVVVPIEPPGLFDDPTVVKYIPPGETEPVDVKLPDGVTSSDVESVVVVSPETTVVTVRDSSGIPAKKIDDLLNKYGG